MTHRSETRWSRLLPRPRDADMTSALRAELHDPLWMLGFSWMTREFQGEDAGSPVRAEIEVERDHFVAYDLDPTDRRDSNPGPQPSGEAPLDALVEREAIVEGRARADGPPLRVAADAGQHFLRLLDEHDYRNDGESYTTASFPSDLRLSAPEQPLEQADRRYANLMAGQTLDGNAVFERLRTAVPDIATAGVEADVWGTAEANPPLPDGEEVTSSYRAAAAAFYEWYAELYDEPTDESGAAWRPEHMEYGFAVATGTGADLAVFEAPEYPGRDMDWDSFTPVSEAPSRTDGTDDRVEVPSLSGPDESLPAIEDLPASRRVGFHVGSVSARDAAEPPTGLSVDPLEAEFLEATDEFAPAGATSRFETSTLPTQMDFPGMPSNRWWEFEDSAVTLSSIAADGATLPRLMLLDFAVQFGNDWFDVPIPTPLGSYSRVTDLTVYDSFGIPETAVPVQEHTDEWNMFMFSADSGTDGHGVGIGHDRPGLFLPPTTGRLTASDPIEEVLLTRDEVANLAFGIERRVESPVGTPVDRGTFQVPALAVERVVPNQDPTEEYVRFRNDGEDELDLTDWAVVREADSQSDVVYEFGELSLGPESAFQLYTGSPDDQPTDPDVRVDTCGRDTSLWGDAAFLTIVADDPDEGGARRLVLRQPFGSVEADADYRIATDLPDNWFPFTMELGDGESQPSFDLTSNEYFLELAILLDASTMGVDPEHIPTPQGRILNPDPTELRDVDLPDEGATARTRFSPLRVFESEVPRSGRRVSREYQLARWTDGETHLWSSRTVAAGEAEVASGLRFDFLEEREREVIESE